MKHLTLDDLVKLNEEENDFIINRMITHWKKGHKDIALDVIHHDYDKNRKKAPAFRHGDELRSKVFFLQFFLKKLRFLT